jgi:hypothetical protein
MRGAEAVFASLSLLAKMLAKSGNSHETRRNPHIASAGQPGADGPLARSASQKAARIALRAVQLAQD